MSEEIRLRPWRENDATRLAELANNPAIARNLRDVFPSPYTMTDAEVFLATLAKEPFIYAVEVDGKVAGGAGIHPGKDVYRRCAEIGYWLGEPYWGRGIGVHVVREITRIGRTIPDLARLQACVFGFNRRSARVLEKAGFHLEGKRERAVFKNGALADELVYALLL